MAKFIFTQPNKRAHYKYRMVNGFAIYIGGYIHGMIDIQHDYILLSDRTLTITSGYAWNGSSMSRDKNAEIASCVHDALYQLMREGWLNTKWRKEVDQLYRDICIDQGTWRWHANLKYFMLRKFAGDFAKPKKKKLKVYTLYYPSSSKPKELK